ncbi:unnamed protein product [Closterium sp. NIES-54]
MADQTQSVARGLLGFCAVHVTQHSTPTNYEHLRSRVHCCHAGATLVTLEARLADARRCHEAGEYGTSLSLEVVELDIQAQWVMEHPSRPASPQTVRNEGGVDKEVDGGAQVGGSEGTRKIGVIRKVAGGEVGGVQARELQSSAAAGFSQGDVGGRRSSVRPATATHVTAGGIAPTYGYF